MHKNPFSYFLSTLNKFKIWVLLLFVGVVVVFSGEHFVDTIIYAYQWIHSKLLGSNTEYPSADLQVEAMYFFSKTATAFLCGLSLLTVFGIFFGPALGFTQILDELVDEKNKLLQSYKQCIEVQKRYQEFIRNIDNHRAVHNVALAKTDRTVEALNLTAIGLHKTVEDLTGRIEYLKTASQELVEDATQAAPKPNMDQGHF